MLSEYTFTGSKTDKAERRAEIKRMKEHLAASQQRLREAGIPVIVLVEGWAAAGKGYLINELISELDPRFFSVFSPKAVSEREERYPFLHKYFSQIPENGKLLFQDSGWMDETVSRYLRREITSDEYSRRTASVCTFERQLRDNGYLVVKLFLHITKAEQLKRLTELCGNQDTSWRVNDGDLWQNREYKRFLKTWDAFMSATGDVTPWHIIDSTGRGKALYEALGCITRAIDEAIGSGRYIGRAEERDFPLLGSPSLQDADYSARLDEKEYKKELNKLQKRLSELHNVIYRKGIPVIICYEGWDAAGKGGNIRRIAYPLDPRGFDVIPIASPTAPELARHYLWRFWTRLPKTGHITIFDRSWYGRVMVERIEGYCTEDDWKRAYGEINEFERELTEWGAVVLKFWVNIDKDTQLERFNARQNTPEKRWKITDEDWRNREKWPQYEEAVEEMLAKTSTTYAPWHIIDSVDKKYARIRALRIVTGALEKAVNDNLVRGMKSACARKNPDEPNK